MSKTYCKPLKRGTSWRSQNFGDNKTVYGPHTGNDEACNSGTPVHAAGDGVIEWAGEFDDTYADNLLWLLRMGGNVAVLNCGSDEPSFVYAHLKTFFVRPGERVRKGQIIALSGNSGTATTGPHLHVECIPPGYVLNSPLLGRVNPDLYLTEWPEDVITIAPQSVETEDEEMAKADIEAIQADLHTVHMAVKDAAASIKADIHTVHLATLNNKPNASAAEFAEAIVGKLGPEFAKTVVAEIGVRISQ